MSSEWNEITFGDFIALQRGHDLPDQDRRPGAVPILGSFGVTGFHDTVKAKGPGVTIGRSGASFGVAAYTSKDYWPLNTALYVTNFKGNNPRFVFYFLKNFDFSAYNSGSAQPSLNRNNLYGISVRVPSPSIQKNIADFLTDIDDRITLLRETNTTLEAITQALFKSWFVDFDPVRAKQQGREPEGMDAETAELFPDSFEESELGLVPMGWRVAALADAFEINPTRTLKKGSIATYLDMAKLATSGHCVETPIQREMSSGAKFRNGDTLLARITPCLENGKSAYVDFLADDQIGWGSTEFLVLRPKAPLPEYFGYLLCRHSAFREYAIQSMSGTSGRQRIQNDVLGRFLLALPNDGVASAFTEVVESIQKSIAGNHETAQTLATLRDTLLPRLISGQLRLPEIEVVKNDLKCMTSAYL
jgi:type I restriction enzyme S subunit